MGNDIISPIKVFISSGCGKDKERYNIVRKGLKEKIEATELAKVYLWESDPRASTLTTEQIYLRVLDDSHVCIFLIDNADGIFDGVAPEIQRAKAKGIKSIYLFCTENSTEPTWAQKDLYGAKGSKFYEISSFTDFAEKAYISLINDIVDIYHRYCRKWLIDNEFEKEGKPLNEVNVVGSESFRKGIIGNLDLTKIYLSKNIFDNHRKVEHSSSFDNCCEKFLKVLLGEKAFSDFNTSIMLMELKKIQSPELHHIVDLRWKAIISYYMNDFVGCNDYLYQALEKAKNSNSPTWMITDILVDCNNIERLGCNISGEWLIEGKSLKTINEQVEPVYYPFLDRLSSNLYEELEKLRNKEVLQSPYTQNFGNNIDRISDYVTSIFAVAVFNGSLTHILMTYDRLKHIALYLCKSYDDWSFRVMLLKFTALSYDRKEMLDILSAFNDVQGKINASDALNVFNVSNCIPIPFKRFIIQLAVFESIGLFFSDDDYSKIGEDLFKQIHDWIAADKPNALYSTNVFKMLQANHSRLNSNEIIKICMIAFEKKYLRYWDNIFELISIMGIEELENSLKIDLINILENIVNIPEYRANLSYLERALITVRKTGGDHAKTLDSFIEKNLFDFYKGVYSLEIFGDKQDISNQHIEQQLYQIEKRNIEQGVNGIYSGYLDYPYTTIRNIIKYNLSLLNYDLASQILEAINNTLMAEKQTMSDKTDAYILATFLRNVTTSEYNELFKSLEAKISKAENIILAGEDIFFPKCSRKIIQFNHFLFILACGLVTSEKIVTIYSSFSSAEEYECIEMLSSLAGFFEMADINKIDRNILYPLLSLSLSYCTNKSHRIRYFAISIIINMLAHDTFSPIVSQLSVSMDFETLSIKCKIIRHIEDIGAFDTEIAEGILQKAKSDTNYIVRQQLRKIYGDVIVGLPSH